MIIELERPYFLLDKNNPTKVSYIDEDLDKDNWKIIFVQTYLHGFPEIKEDEILYRYKENRGYIGKF